MSVSAAASRQRQWYILDVRTNPSHKTHKKSNEINNILAKFYNSLIDSDIFNSYNVPIW